MRKERGVGERKTERGKRWPSREAKGGKELGRVYEEIKKTEGGR